MNMLPKFVFLWVVYCLTNSVTHQNEHDGIKTLAKPYVPPLLNLIKKHHESRESQLNLEVTKPKEPSKKSKTTPTSTVSTYSTTIPTTTVNNTNATTPNVTLSPYEKILATAKWVFPHLDYEGHEEFLIWLYNDSANCAKHGKRMPFRRYFTLRYMNRSELMSTPFYIPESHLYYYHYIQELDKLANKTEHTTLIPDYPTPRRRSNTTSTITTSTTREP